MAVKFEEQNREEWNDEIIGTFGNAVPLTRRWNALKDIVRILSPFMRINLNHTLLPDSGGMDMEEVCEANEAGCIEMCPSPHVAYVFRPNGLYFEYFPESPWNSFLLLELSALKPCGVYPFSNGKYEEVAEIAPAEYVNRSVIDEGNLGYDENEEEIPLPASRRIVLRYFGGKCLIVAKSSYWNQDNSTYDGRHSRMTHEQIRELIQKAINQFGA